MFYRPPRFREPRIASSGEIRHAIGLAEPSDGTRAVRPSCSDGIRKALLEDRDRGEIEDTHNWAFCAGQLR
jgi:hypothetical protein